MPAILDVLIGVTFIYLIFSLLVSSLNEIILSWLDKRADFLKEGLRELLQSDERVSKLLGHGLVDALSRKRNGNPSYIGPGPFVAAVLDIIKPADPTKVRTLDEIRTAIAMLPAGDKFKESMSALLDGAGDELAKFKADLGTWYDHSMERVSGWYKRYAQKWLFVLGLLLAVSCNVDSIHITEALAADPNLAAATADQAVKFVKAHPQVDSNQPAASGLDPVIQNARRNLESLNALRLPIGWDEGARQPFGAVGPDDKIDVGRNVAIVITAILGWLLTALAATLGAPFWFDTLNRFINVRANGRSPDERDPTKEQIATT